MNAAVEYLLLQVRGECRGGDGGCVRDGRSYRGDSVEPLQDTEGRHAVVLHSGEHGQGRRQEQKVRLLVDHDVRTAPSDGMYEINVTPLHVYSRTT